MHRKLLKYFSVNPVCFLLLTLTAISSDTCPSHDEIKAHARLDRVIYEKSHAEMYFKLKIHGQPLVLTFRIPAKPPFSRPASSHYASDSRSFDRGEINWGFTNHYKTDFASTLLKYIAYRDAYPTEKLVDCLYLSVLENHFLYGHIWMSKA